MKEISLPFFKINKKNSLIFVLFIIWSFLFVKFFIMQIKTIKPLFNCYAYNEEQKYRIIDGKFYNFMKFCKVLIPEKDDVVFYIFPSEPLVYSRDWFIKEYFVQKAPYYLYPRKVFTVEMAKNKKLDYIIVYNPEFKYLLLYYKDKLIPYVTN